MSNDLKFYLYAVGLFIIYGFIFYYIGTAQANVDFTSFYASSLAFLKNKNPYTNLSTYIFDYPSGIPTNLNPPFFILMLSPLTYFTYTQASLLFSMSSLILGSFGVLICFYCCVTPQYYKKNRRWFILIYLSTYATIINTHIIQIAGFLFFFIMYGYYLFLKKKDYKAGIFWGIAIAIKLFPALLLLFALSKKRYLVCCTMLVIWCITWISVIPFQGVEIYDYYIQNLNTLFWYGNSWNGSILGFLYRLLVNTKTQTNILVTHLLYVVIFITLLIGYGLYLIKIKEHNEHRTFCITLTMMIIMSPLGWNYYFNLLTLPLLVVFQYLMNQDYSRFNLWILTLFLLNFPLGNQPIPWMHSFISKATVNSIYFYGLVLLSYLLLYVSKMKPNQLINVPVNAHYLFIIELSLGLGVITILITFLKHSLII